jgi:hypothetical protein
VIGQLVSRRDLSQTPKKKEGPEQGEGEARLSVVCFAFKTRYYDLLSRTMYWKCYKEHEEQLGDEKR